MIKRFMLLFFIVLFLNSCAEIQKFLQMSNIQKPTAQIVNGKLAGLSFTQADLVFEVQINNPNTVGVNLAGMDYDLKINNFSLLSGNQNKGLEIAAKGSSTVQIPLSLKYADIYKTVTSLGSQEKSTYAFSGGLSFKLPVLGDVRIPVSHSGELPLLKIPKISVKSINMKTLSWQGAELQLELNVKSEGGLGLLISNMNYGLDIAGKKWVSGDMSRQIALNSNQNQTISIPFKLDFLQMGRSLYDVVTGDSEMNYNLTGSMNLSSDNSLLKTTNISFEDLNKIKITK